MSKIHNLPVPFFSQKKTALTFLLFQLVFSLHAAAPELRNVMPGSWHMLTRLSAAEQEAYVDKNPYVTYNVLATFRETILRYDDDMKPIMTPAFLSVYKYEVSDCNVYKIIYAETEKPDFMDTYIEFVQGLVYEGKLVFMGLRVPECQLDLTLKSASIPGQ